jgi:3,4-dihydroxyphenylacetate 2,3-dioxygenase
VVESAHWVSTFNWFATLQNPHRGICVATEAIELIPGMPYERKGDPAFGSALIEAFKPHGVPAFPNASEHYSWDYAGLVPLLHMDPDAELPVIQIPTVLAADHNECRLAGRLVDEAARAAGRRAVFIASSALTHAVVRGRHNWPTPERMDMDRRMIALLCAGDLEAIDAWFLEYSIAVKAEMGGRVLATLLGAMRSLSAGGRKLSGTQYGDYAQSSGSGNVNVLVTPA